MGHDIIDDILEQRKAVRERTSHRPDHVLLSQSHYNSPIFFDISVGEYSCLEWELVHLHPNKYPKEVHNAKI